MCRSARKQEVLAAVVARKDESSTSRGELARRVGLVSFADLSAVLLRQVEDDSGRGQGAELERDEHEVAAMDGKRADQQAGHEPHRPRATADARRAVFPP